MTNLDTIIAAGFTLSRYRDRKMRNSNGQKSDVYFRYDNDNSKCKQEIWLTKTDSITGIIYGYNKPEEIYDFKKAEHVGLKEKLESIGLEFRVSANGIKAIAISEASVQDVFELFDWLDSMIEVQGRSRTRKTADAGYFMKAAAFIQHCVQTEFWDPIERGSLGFDAHDDLFVVGKSKAVLTDPTAPTWREHLVPCALIKEEAIRMVQAGESLGRLARMLQQNLVIAIITQDEQELIDSKFRTTMPPSWKFGDCVFERLNHFNVQI